MFQPFLNADRDLRGKPVPAAEYGRADHGSKSGVDERLTAHHHETTVKFRIVAGLVNAINLASPHRRNPLFFCRLVAENVFYLCVQFVRGSVDELEIASFDLRALLFAQVLSQHRLDKSRARLLRSRNAINASEHLFG